jgi:hypothetical protein
MTLSRGTPEVEIEEFSLPLFVLTVVATLSGFPQQGTLAHPPTKGVVTVWAGIDPTAAVTAIRSTDLSEQDRSQLLKAVERHSRPRQQWRISCAKRMREGGVGSSRDECMCI